jgi:hypothetical protein
MVPYMTGEKKHGEFVNSKTPFDRQRAQNHEKGYIAGTMFDPKTGVFALSLAAYFDPAYIPVIKEVAEDGQATTGDNSYTNWQLVLNSVKRK